VSGEGRAPLNSALFAQPDELGYVGVFGFTSDTPDGAGDSVWTDHYFGAGTAAYTLTADAGSYTITGQTANLTSTRTLTADAGSYTIGGQDATLSYGRILTADAGAYTIGGQDASLTSTRTLTADAGAYTISGQDAALTSTRTLTAEAGAYVISGQDADLTYTPAGVSPPPPSVIIDVDGDIDLQIGHRVIQIRRPKRLELERAEKLVIKRVSKALKGSKKARAEYATQTVSHVLREMQSALDWRPVANLALGLQDTIDRADIAKIDAFWAAVQAAALQTLEEEEEDDLLLLS
jgi:hypothetical protein